MKLSVYNPFTGKKITLGFPGNGKSPKNRTKFSTENVIVEVEDGLKVTNSLVDTIKNVIQEAYDNFDMARQTAKIGKNTVTVATQSPEGKSWYAQQVANKRLANYRVGWVYRTKGKSRDWIAKFGIIYRRNNNGYQPVLRIVAPDSTIGFYGEPDNNR